MKDFENLLAKTSKNKAENPVKNKDSLAGQLSQFDKADAIMNGITKQDTAIISKVQDKITYVTYAIPESLVKIINDTIKKCMREEVSTNKSEIIRLGIHMVNELPFEELTKRLNEVKREKGRPKED